MDETEFIKELARWEKMSDQLKKLKEAEMALRCKLSLHAFPKAEEGTHYHPLAGDWALQNKQPFYYKVNETTIGPVLKGLPHIAEDDLIKWTPELKLTAYRALKKSDKDALAEAITISPGKPAFNIMERKRKSNAKK